jgi:hypothetical protein
MQKSKQKKIISPQSHRGHRDTQRRRISSADEASAKETALEKRPESTDEKNPIIFALSWFSLDFLLKTVWSIPVSGMDQTVFLCVLCDSVVNLLFARVVCDE